MYKNTLSSKTVCGRQRLRAVLAEVPANWKEVLRFALQWPPLGRTCRLLSCPSAQ